MSKQRALFNKVTAVLEKQARNSATNLSFSIYLDDSPPEIYRTRGYQPNEQCSQPINPQTEDTPHEQ